MKDTMERFAILPFSMGCVSESSVDVGMEQPKSSRTKPPSITTKREEEEEESPSSIAEYMKSSSLKFPKPSISKILKSFTQLFVYKEEMEDELEMEMEMEIGYPTDVKHVTHIGLEGLASTNPTQGWDSLIAPPRHRHLLSGDDPLKQFELSMAATQASFVPRHHI